MKSLLDKTLIWAVATAMAMPVPAVAMAQSATPTQGASTQGTAPAQSTAEAPLRQEELEQLLAPIALYPDSLLAQVLMASTYPLEIVQAARWLKANPKVTGKALEDAMQKQRWDPSVKSLTAMPQVLEMMDAKIDWTQKLGDAFLAQQAQVMQTVQALRAKASAAGNLKSTPEQQVSTVQEGGQSVIVIEPANPQVVYVPTYDPAVIYGPWPYPAYPPYYYYPPGLLPGRGMFWFGAGMLVGAAIWGGCNWAAAASTSTTTTTTTSTAATSAATATGGTTSITAKVLPTATRRRRGSTTATSAAMLPRASSSVAATALGRRARSHWIRARRRVGGNDGSRRRFARLQRQPQQRLRGSG